MEKYITLAHGSGGRASSDLIENLFLKYFSNDILNELHDGAKLNIPCTKLAFTTDSYVVKPHFFAGGNIGKLAICGTVNDLAMTGAVPLYISVGFIIEEGFLIEDLEKIVASMKDAARKAKVQIVTGDTKVVEKGSCDGIYINTSGVGALIDGVNISPKNVTAGQKIILSGNLGDHATTIMASRYDLSLPSSLQSDCAPLNQLAQDILKADNTISMLRDVTRGGLAMVLNEVAKSSNVGILIEEEAIPVKDEVRGFCDILGFDPLYLANEGKFIIFTQKENAEKILSIMKEHPYGKDAQIIGEVVENPKGEVGLKTLTSGIRLIDMPVGAQTPRIC